MGQIDLTTLGDQLPSNCYHNLNLLRTYGHDKVVPQNYYRPPRSCGKVMFSQASVILFTEGGLCQGDPPETPWPLDRDAPVR